MRVWMRKSDAQLGVLARGWWIIYDKDNDVWVPPWRVRRKDFIDLGEL